MSRSPLLRIGFRALLVAALPAVLIAPGCARSGENLRPTPAPDAAALPARPVLRSDVEDNPESCQAAKERLKQLVRQAAVGCSPNNPCLVDQDCLIRTAAANAQQVQDARMAMEQACPSSPITRDSCPESPARCESGRCVLTSARR
jgi:hypothetical protein